MPMAFNPRENNEGGPKPALAGNRIDESLKEQLQGKLNLPRRTEVAGWETRALDHSKRTAGCCENGIAKVRMVENIEHFAPELEIEFLGQFRIFCDREVSIEEARPGDRVSPQSSRMTSSENYRIDLVVR